MQLNKYRHVTLKLVEVFKTGAYSCDTLGNVYSHFILGGHKDRALSKHPVRRLAEWRDPFGYLKINVTIKGSEEKHPYKRLRVTAHSHVAVWTYFKGPILNGFQIDHLDGNKSNNSINNLELVTAQENVVRTFKRGRKAPNGSSRYNSKISEREAIQIVHLWNSGLTVRKICHILKCSPSIAASVIYRINWRQVTKNMVIRKSNRKQPEKSGRK